MSDDPIKEALQTTVDDGWIPNHYVVVAAFEKFLDHDQYQTATVLLVAPGQPEYVTRGLLATGEEIRSMPPDCDGDDDLG